MGRERQDRGKGEESGGDQGRGVRHGKGEERRGETGKGEG